MLPGYRLGCAAHIIDDVVIDVPSESQVHRQVIRKRAGVDNLPVDPVIRLYYIEVAEPDLASPTGDAERVLLALAGQWNLEDLKFASQVLREMQTTLRRGSWKVTVAVRANAVVAIWPDFRDRALGVAFDIGSTTIAGHLCDLFTGAILSSSGRMNPQIGFGEDLMSRVSYVMMNDGGEKRLSETVRQALNDVIGELVAEAEVEREDVLELAVVGNPIMHHLFLGFDPRELGTAPFALVTDVCLETPASTLGLQVHPGSLRLHAALHRADMSAQMPRGPILSEGPHRTCTGATPRRRRHQRRDRARKQGPAPCRVSRRPALPSKAPRSHRGKGLRPERSSGFGSTARPSNRESR